jgi:hypothetical protein
MPSPLAALMQMGSPSQSTETDEPEAVDNPKEESTENSINIPDGLKTPESHKDGDSFQGTFRGYIKDGKLCFRSINNIPLEGNEEGETPSDEESETPEEQSNEEKMGMEDHPMDEEDKAWKSKQKETNAFKKAFHGK